MRSFVPVLVGFLVTVAAPASAQAPVDIAPFVASEVDPKVHLLSTPDDYFGPVIGNVILIEQSDGLVLVDSGLTAGNGRAVVRYARSLTSKPIKAVMITHWHNDHPQGISAIRDAFPKVRIISTRETEAGMLGPEAFDIGYAPGAKWDEATAKLTAKQKELFQKLLDDPTTAEDRKGRIRKAMNAEPFMVAGTGRFCTRVNGALPGVVQVKTGAEAVFCGMLPTLGLGIALKMWDGAGRASEVAMATLLAHLGVLPAERREELLHPPVKNVVGLLVGELRPAKSWLG